MTVSSFTEKALAESLKKLMTAYPVNKIRIKMITDDCGLTRHTFYNHFKDVYDLLGWIYENEIIDDLEKSCELKHWKEGILLVLQYTLNNQTICLNTFRSLGRDHLEAFLFKVFSKVLTGIIDDITLSTNADEKIKKETAEFYANAISGVFIAWLKQGLKEDPNRIADRIEMMLKGNIFRLMEMYCKNQS